MAKQHGYQNLREHMIGAIMFLITEVITTLTLCMAVSGKFGRILFPLENINLLKKHKGYVSSKSSNVLKEDLFQNDLLSWE